jgi:hypothetical protein
MTWALLLKTHSFCGNFDMLVVPYLYVETWELWAAGRVGLASVEWQP